MWYAMIRHGLLTIIRDLLHCYLLGIIHIMWLPQRGCWSHWIYIFFYLPNNQHPCGLFLHSFCIHRWSRDFLQSYCRFCCHFCCYFPIYLTLYDHICHTCYIFKKITCYSCLSIYFLRCSTLEPSLLILLFTVFLLFSSAFQNQRIYLFKYLNSIFAILTLKIILLACTIQVRHRRHVR